MKRDIFNNTPSLRETLFYERARDIIGRILEKYDLEKIQERAIDMILNAKTEKELKEGFSLLPGTNIKQVITQYIKGEVSLDEIPLILKEKLNIPLKKAQLIANELENFLFPFIPKEMFEEKEKEEKTQTPKFPPRSQKQPDIYREPIE